MTPSYIQPNYPQPTTTSQIANQVQPQYSTANNIQPAQSSQPHQVQTSQHSSVNFVLNILFYIIN